MSFTDEFDKEMRHFQREMEKTKKAWRERKKLIEKRTIKWNYEQYDGHYEREAKGGVPHGLGKWKRKGNHTIEGEWKDGQIYGKVAENLSSGYRVEYEIKDGQRNGKYI